RIAGPGGGNGRRSRPLRLPLPEGGDGPVARALRAGPQPLHPLHALRARLRRDRGGAHLGRRWPRRQQPGDRRTEAAMGRLVKLHFVRQVRAGLPDGGAVLPGLDGRRDAARQGEARLPGAGAGEERMGTLKLATVWLGGCSGCHMSFLDLDDWLFELAVRADVVFTPVMDVKEYPDGVDVALVEGAVANEEHLEMIWKVRERTRTLVSFGDCAVTGNVTALRNPLGVALEVLRPVYEE